MTNYRLCACVGTPPACSHKSTDSRRTPMFFAANLIAILAVGCWELPAFDTPEDNNDSYTDTGTESDTDTAVVDAECPGNVCVISGALTEDKHWRAENRYILRGLVLVGDGEQETRLTIDPGTHIFGERQTTGMLVVQRHAKIYAEGTEAAPIVFSSDREAKERRRGDWGGIVINGNALINGCEETTPCALYGDTGTGWYGGENNTDDSGVLRYVRIEYAGKQLGPSLDHGGLSLRGVGSGTMLEHIHLHMNDNDGITVVGGSADLKYILSTGSAEDGFAWTGGWRGRAQYIVTQQHDDAGGNGLSASNHKDMVDAVPVSSPKLYNLTLVGAPTTIQSHIGIMLSEGTGGEIRSSLVVGFNEACIDIDEPETWDRIADGDLSLYDTLIDCDTEFAANHEETDPPNASAADFFYSGAGNHAANVQLKSPFSTTVPDFAPDNGSPANNGAVTPKDSFFDGVSFLGAVDPSNDWTKASWITDGLQGTSSADDPLNSSDVKNELDCSGNTCIASGTYTSDMHWTSDKLYILRGGVFIGDGESKTALIIDPGTEIHGESATVGFLAVQQNATMTAVGTPKEPIVFTSDKPAGERARGDWGGIIINGKAPINGCDTSVCESWGEGGTGWYGGSDPEDNSGELAYIRIAFAGRQLGPDNELNGLALQGVGSGTRLSHLHLHMNKDDAVEFFGGTVSAKYVLATGTGDDTLDWTEGWQGKVQFFVAQQYWDGGDNGIEADNSHADNDAEPFSNPTVANFTMIGFPTATTSDIGMLLREGTRGKLLNGVVMGFEDACLDVDHSLTWQNASDKSLRLEGIILDCAVPFNDNYAETDPEDASLEAFFDMGKDNLLGDPGIDDPFERETPRFAPLPGSAAAEGAVPNDDDFFDSVGFKGGVDPNDDWVSKGIFEGWIDITGL